jgi:hypothetical protein
VISAIRMVDINNCIVDINDWGLKAKFARHIIVGLTSARSISIVFAKTFTATTLQLAWPVLIAKHLQLGRSGVYLFEQDTLHAWEIRRKGNNRLAYS